MKAKLFFALTCSFLLMGISSSAGQLPLSVGIDDNTPIMGPPIKMPPKAPSLEQDGHSILFEDQHSDYTLCIVDDNGVIVYSCYVPSSVITVTLPSTLSGDYELRLYPDGSSIYFYGDITL